eukprot:gene19184-biopygen19029
MVGDPTMVEDSTRGWGTPTMVGDLHHGGAPTMVGPPTMMGSVNLLGRGRRLLCKCPPCSARPLTHAVGSAPGVVEGDRGDWV